MDYEYDADGNRVKKVIDGNVTINYLVDTNRPYAQVVEERDNAGNLLVHYVYGHDLISQTRGNVTSYYHYDGLGSTRALSSSAGIVTDEYTYDAFGNLLDKTGNTSNEYLYTGEFFDSHIGFYYLRARYMSPAIGRFVTMDEFAGSRRDPYSLHKYLYAHANPVNRIDPSGYITVSEVAITTGIVGVLSGIATQLVGLEAVSNFYAGFGDTLTSGFGLTYLFRVPSFTQWLRRLTDADDVVNRRSLAYAMGQAGGHIWALTLGGAILAEWAAMPGLGNASYQFENLARGLGSTHMITGNISIQGGMDALLTQITIAHEQFHAFFIAGGSLGMIRNFTQGITLNYSHLLLFLHEWGAEAYATGSIMEGLVYASGQVNIPQLLIEGIAAYWLYSELLYEAATYDPIIEGGE